MSSKKNPHAVALGRRGGKVCSERKAAAARKNARKAGRKPNPRVKQIMQERGVSRQWAHELAKREAQDSPQRHGGTEK